MENPERVEGTGKALVDVGTGLTAFNPQIGLLVLVGIGCFISVSEELTLNYFTGLLMLIGFILGFISIRLTAISAEL